MVQRINWSHLSEQWQWISVYKTDLKGRDIWSVHFKNMGEKKINKNKNMGGDLYLGWQKAFFFRKINRKKVQW